MQIYCLLKAITQRMMRLKRLVKTFKILVKL